MIHGDPDDILWLAGLLEGEGTFDAHRGKYPRIRLAMTDRDVVGRAASLMGTTLRLSLHPAPVKATWHSEVSGPRAAEIMREILPHMGARRSGKIAEVLGVVAFPALAAASKPGASTPGPRVTRAPATLKPDGPA
jgi:hypothetical protein